MPRHQPAPSTVRPAALVALAALGVLVGLTLAMAGAPLYTDDLWWHLAAGEMYLREGLWPTADAMLHTALESGPVQHEWLFGVLVHAVEAAAGFHGLRVLHAAAVGAVVWLAWSVAARTRATPALAALAVCAFVVLAAPRLAQLRPDLVSIPAALVGYRLLVEAGTVPTPRAIAWFALLVALWCNTHSLFLVGINLAFAALLGVVLEAALVRIAVRGAPPDLHARARVAGLGIAIATALLAAALNPRGFGQHLTFFSSTQDAAIWLITDEWSRFDPFDLKANHASVGLVTWLVGDVVLIAFAIGSAARGVQLVRERSGEALRRFDPVHLGLGLAGVVAALVSIRFLWMLIFPSLYVLRALAPVAGRVRWASAWAGALGTLALAAWFPFGHGFAGVVTRFASDPAGYLRVAYRGHKYHAEGVHFLQATGVEGNLYNGYWMGGFLGYWLRPRLRTFIDGRTEHYGRDVYDDYSAVLGMGGARAGELFTDVLDRRGVDLHFGVGFPGWWYGVYTTPHLEGMPGWKLVSRSYRHAIRVRDLPRNAENLARIEAWYAAEGVPFDVDEGLDPGRVIAERPDWAMRHAMLPPDYPSLLRSARTGPADVRAAAIDRLAVLYLLNGAYEAQIDLERERLALEPQALASRLRLAYALLKIGRIEQGRREVERALEAHPDDARARRLARAARQVARVRAGLVPSQRGVREQVFVNRVLWQAVPVDARDTWPLEHAIETEGLPLVRPAVSGG
jgi:hypothetical protein